MYCKRCKNEFNNDKVPKKYLLKNLEKYNYCVYCRKYRNCKNCELEFHHKQNQTCSEKCTQELKEKSFMISCGTKHNFYRESVSRIKWERNLIENEGIVNVFQREDVKEKIKKTVFEKYGVYCILKSDVIKEKIKETLKKTIELNPNLYKENWHIAHKKFIKEIGYDPRLHLFGKASIESLNIFNPLIDWCLENNILEDDIYIGSGGKKEYFISFDKKIYFYDFTIRSKKIIIEYNGTFFHARENSTNWYNTLTKESGEDNFRRNKIKKEVALNSGFKLLEIWSDEYPIKNLELCKNFIIQNL